MLEILKFIFSFFWIWLGSVILFATIASSFGGLIRLTVKPIVRESAKSDK